MSKDLVARGGRPRSTTHAAIEAAAFALFHQQGFEDTTVDQIASAAGIGRRTLFRYYTSKNDIPWGLFDDQLAKFQDAFDTTPVGTTLLDAVVRAVMEFNRIPDDALPQHRQRMRLLLSTPALQAHSVLRYEQWRAVVAAYAASRHGVSPEHLIPRTIGHISLAMSLSAYEQWLRDDAASLPELLAGNADLLRRYACE